MRLSVTVLKMPVMAEEVALIEVLVDELDILVELVLVEMEVLQELRVSSESSTVFERGTWMIVRGIILYRDDVLEENVDFEDDVLVLVLEREDIFRDVVTDLVDEVDEDLELLLLVEVDVDEVVATAKSAPREASDSLSRRRLVDLVEVDERLLDFRVRVVVETLNDDDVFLD